MARKLRHRINHRSHSQSGMPILPLSPYATGHSLGLTSAFVLFIAAIISWFSDYTGAIIIGQYPLYFSLRNWTLIIGLLQTYAISYVFGFVFARIYNRN